MIKKYCNAMMLVIFSLSTLFSAQAEDVSKLNPISKLAVSSKLYEGTIDFNVTLPPNYQQNKDKRYIVLFDFHQRAQPMLSGMHDWLSHNGSWPWLETLIVTPTDTNEQLTQMYIKLGAEKDGSQLLDFMENDLFKAIDKNYRTKGFRIFNGFTGNASVGLYTLFHRPNLFNAYIIASPNLAGDYLGLMPLASDKLKQLGDKPRFLQISMSGSNFEKAHQSGFASLEEQLQAAAPKQLTWQAKRFDDFTYMSQPVMALMHGIEAIFSDINHPLKADSAIAQKGAKAVLAHYKYLSEQKFGFEISAEDTLTAMGKSLMKEDPQKALTVFKASVDTYPESAWAIHALADAYAQLKQFDKAIHYQKQAKQKAQKMIEWHQMKMQQFLEQYQAAAK